MTKTAHRVGAGQTLKRDMTYRLALSPTTVKVGDVVEFIENFIAAERLPEHIKRSLCIKTSRKFRIGETEIAIRGRLDNHSAASPDFDRVSKLVRRIASAVEKEFFNMPLRR